VILIEDEWRSGNCPFCERSVNEEESPAPPAIPSPPVRGRRRTARLLGLSVVLFILAAGVLWYLSWLPSKVERAASAVLLVIRGRWTIL
jgi:hypothetical protein